MIRTLIAGVLALAATPAPDYTARQHNARIAGSYDMWIAVIQGASGPMLNYNVVSPEEELCNARGRAAASRRTPHLTCVRAKLHIPER